MSRFGWIVTGLIAIVAAVVALGVSGVLMPGLWQRPNLASAYNGLVPAEKLLRVPVTGIYPGGNTRGLAADIQNPLADDPDAVTRGMQDFENFNCSGCHMANGGGGMGPALSNAKWLYGSSPANIYLSIAQGRGAGMPAFGAMLPDRTIWELVAYIQSLGDNPVTTFGDTTSADPAAAPREQVAAGQIQSPTPWRYTEPTPPNGQRPGGSPPDAPLPPDAQQPVPPDRIVPP